MRRHEGLARRLADTPRRRWLKRLVVGGLYAGLLTALLGASSYLALSNFVRSGVIAVPDLVGLNVGEAEDALAAAGLTVRRVEQDRHDDTVPAGHVLRHDPAAGKRRQAGQRRRDSPVTGTSTRRNAGSDRPGPADGSGQSRGLRPAAGQEPERVRGVWRPRRRDPSESTSRQPGRTLFPGRRDGQPGQPGRIVRHARSDRPAGSARALLLRDTRIPLRKGKVRAYEGVEAGIVLRQYPLPGHPLRQGDSIALVVAAQESH